MPMPKTYEECEQRARALATEAVRQWEQRDQSGQHLNDFAEDEFHDVYSSELRVLLDLVGDREGNGIDRSANDLVRICCRMRFETGAPSTLGIAVAALIKTAEERSNYDPQIALREMIAALVDIFGVAKIRAAVGVDPRHHELMREEFEVMRTREKNLPPGGSWHNDELIDEFVDVCALVLRLGVGRGATLLINDLAGVTDEPLRVAIDLLLKAAGLRWGRDLPVSLSEVIAGLVEIFGPDRIHAAVTANSELGKG